MSESKAFKKFKKTIHRCNELHRSYKVIHGVTDMFKDEKDVRIPLPHDIIRGSVVLSISALDAYITDVFSEKLVSYLKNHKADDELIQILYDAGLDTREALTLIQMDRPFRRIRNLMDQYYNNYTTQKFDVIDNLFKTYRLIDITENAQRKSGKKNLKATVQKLIDRRHKIAHDGDYNAYGKITAIDDVVISKRIKSLDLLVQNIDEIINNRIR